ncbi:phenazine biosynthesis protein PhzF [Rhodoferax koreense]|uniref:Phenazine biosynthesis protein PhzF n=1 Tax=Rhodoferax koreensis TaxID=1842727 RepID=A0A1P8JS64_9BURK|nr:PhzF family phenazine biosynthesis protein [Rhodoferax koreense]APW36604.1 phenazine biosynthesis protein PhzF [Rhodoferax koreense]
MDSSTPPRQRPFKQVDVFSGQAYFGNPLAVVLDGEGLSDAQMLRFANWTNLSETTFLLPPTPEGRAGGADYRVRIFTPGGEMRFAGHPTLGSCHAWLQAGGRPRATQRVVQECAVGLVAVRRNDTRLSFAAPPLKRTAPGAMQLAQIAAALGLKSQQIIAAQMLDNGTAWLGLLLDDPHTVLQLKPNQLELKSLGLKVGVAAFYADEQGSALISRSNREARAFGNSPSPAPAADDEAAPNLEVRAFAAPVGILEDPVTGSLNASLAQWLIAEGHAPANYLAAQGTCLERAGRVFVTTDAQGQVWVGGESVTCIDGTVLL